VVFVVFVEFVEFVEFDLFVVFDVFVVFVVFVLVVVFAVGVVLIIIGVTHFNGSYLFDVLSFKKSSWINPFKLIIFLPYIYELL